MGREVPSNTPGDGPDPGPLLDLAIVGAGPHALALYARLGFHDVYGYWYRALAP